MSGTIAALGKVCTACNTDRKKKSILYHPDTLMPYCEHPYICNEEHPNSPKNLITRGTEIQLIPFEEAQEKFTNWLLMNQPDKEKAEAIRRMVTMPTTIRIGSPDLARFILDLKEELQFSSISDTIRYCVQQMKEAEHAYYHKYQELEEKQEVEKRVEEAIKEIEQPTPKMKTVPDDDDDDMTF